MTKRNFVEVDGRRISPDRVIQELGPLLTPERRQRVDQVLLGRTWNCSVVLENLYDRGNISAVLRSAEAFGLAQIHLIQNGEKFKESQRTTAGADKWLEISKWKSTTDCLAQLKSQGIQVVATHLSADADPIDQIDFSVPTAIVLGNEKEGISEEMIKGSDQRVILPMVGFVQSFNISVAAALCFYQIHQSRKQKLGKVGDFSEEQKNHFRALYYMRTLDSAVDILRNSLASQPED